MTGTLQIIVNAGGGAAAKAGDKLHAQLTQQFAEAGIAAAVELIPGARIAKALAAALQRGDRVVIGGGDGTIGSAALAVATAGATLGILPLGTRNHLARQLGLGELDQAIAAIAAGQTQSIDIGRIGDRAFVNNASIGLYPTLVRLRDDAPLPKALANIPAAWSAIKQLRHHRLRVTIDGAAETIRTPLLFIGNNLYSLERGSLGERISLSDGQLGVYAIAAKSRLGLIGFAASALRGRIDYERDFAQMTACTQLTIGAHAGSLDVALDGEPVRLPTPLTVQVMPRALKVLAP